MKSWTDYKSMFINEVNARELKSHCRNEKFLCCIELKGGVYSDHRVQISTSMILPEVLLQHLNTSLLPIFLWFITGAEVEPVVHIWPLTFHWGTNRIEACVLGALALWCDGSRQWALLEPIPHGTPCHYILCIIHMAWEGCGEKQNMEKEASRFKTFSDHKELLLNLPWSD